MGNSEIQVRQAKPTDEPAIRACVEAAYQPYLERMDTPPAPVLDNYAELVSLGVVHVASRDDSLVGIIVMWPKDDHFYIDNIAVSPDAQGAGVAGMLLKLAEDRARAANRYELRLYTNEAMTENLSYYPRKGFVETHRHTDAGYRRVYFARSLLPIDPGTKAT